ncbi:MAG: helix-hairpin-helix domain-containing protein, partial [Gammaproteobacteria bacterium]
MISANTPTPAGHQKSFLTGTVDSVRFSSADTGWACLIVKDDTGELHTVVGTGHGINAGHHVRCEGEWNEHPKFGRQLKASAIIPNAPTTRGALEKYLASGAVEGIGKGYASKLVRIFGERLPKVLDKDPAQLECVNGIGPERRRKISQSWNKQKEIREIMMFLQEHGLGPQRAAQIHRRYGKQAAAIITGNPYRLTEDFHGIGFSIADTTALSFGIAKDDPKRLYAGLRQILTNRRLRGDCAVPETTLITQTAKLLKVTKEAVIAELRNTLDVGRLQGEPIHGEKLIFLPPLRQAEIEVANRLAILAKGRVPWAGFNVETEIHNVERRLGIRLSESQRRAVIDLVTHKVCVITGGPGSGKTTLTKVLLGLLGERVKSIVLCAPTG